MLDEATCWPRRAVPERKPSTLMRINFATTQEAAFSTFARVRDEQAHDGALPCPAKLAPYWVNGRQPLGGYAQLLGRAYFLPLPDQTQQRD